MTTNDKETAEIILGKLKGFSKEEIIALLVNPGAVQKLLAELVIRGVADTYARPLSDEQAWEQYGTFGTKSRGILDGKYIYSWRKAADWLDYKNGPIIWHVRSGFTLVKHAPLAGPVIIGPDFLESYPGFVDEPTKESLVFWIPRLVPDSLGKNVARMKEYLAEIKKLFRLPADHATTFGSIQQLMALLMTNYKYTLGDSSFGENYCVSDSMVENGQRLVAGLYSSSRNFDFHCYHHPDDRENDSQTGFSLIGIEEIGH